MNAKTPPHVPRPRYDLRPDEILSKDEASVLSKVCNGEPLELTTTETTAALRMSGLSDSEMVALVNYFRDAQKESIT